MLSNKSKITLIAALCSGILVGAGWLGYEMTAGKTAQPADTVVASQEAQALALKSQKDFGPTEVGEMQSPTAQLWRAYPWAQARNLESFDLATLLGAVETEFSGKDAHSEQANSTGNLASRQLEPSELLHVLDFVPTTDALILRNLMGAPEVDTRMLMVVFDQDRNGALTYTDVQQFVTKKFESADRNKDGQLSARDFEPLTGQDYAKNTNTP